MEQRSEEWFKARKGKLTGSNVGAALGLNPWKSPEDLIRQMVREYHGYESEFTGNIATEYGQMHEPLALMDYMGKTGIHPEETGFHVHPEHEWLGASPDALLGATGVLEVKCPFGQRDKNPPNFKSSKQQPHYYAQMQIEMACTETDTAHFYQWCKHGDKLEVVYFDSIWWEGALPKLRAFYDWYLSELDNPEHLEPKEKEINTLKARKLIEEYDQASARIDNDAARKKEILSELVAMSKERNAIIHGRKLTKVERKGSIDYKKVPELKGVDLEPYRKSSSEFWRFS